MCGIAAIFNYRTGTPVAREAMRRMLTHMQRRGPDGEGEWYGLADALGLGHRRLSIIDLSEAGAQPMVSADGRLVVVFNGEIYNYRQLRAELEADGAQFRSHSDTEVLLQLYRIHGPAMLPRLRGMFTFALWDNERRGLLLARDPYGIKPLYYSDDGQTLRVASQVRTLLAGGGIDATPEPAGHAGFLLWGHVPEPFTFHKAIRALPAGTTLWVSDDGHRHAQSFCSVAEVLAAAENESPKSADGSSHAASWDARFLRDVLSDTVAHHLIADVPVGVFLSSGLDSTTLAALAAEQGGTLRTVTLAFAEYAGTTDDEAPLAEIVARQYGAQHQTIRVTRRDFTAAANNLFAAMDQPSLDGVNTFFVSLAAKRAGLKVALSGLGGDELFGGYPSFAQIPRTVAAFGWLGAGTRLGRAVRVLTAPLVKRFTSPKYAGLLEYGGNYGGAYLLRRGLFMPWELPEVLAPELARQGWEDLQSLARLEETVRDLHRPRSRVTALESCWYMRNQLLRDADWAGMAHSLEIRVPLVDIGLLRALAPACTGPHPPTKRDLARTPASALPASVLNRPKTGFFVPVRQWLLESDRKSGTRNSESSARGLRGWARHVYSRFAVN
ncbi:MAG: asparagine synthase (glutamine-hydrolyzing) [Verrucomicrobia bacterium]|nr:asparagine synthase (glutamine-hydrolyzing) [Verrucomicrobiota bacterium]